MDGQTAQFRPLQKIWGFCLFVFPSLQLKRATFMPIWSSTTWPACFSLSLSLSLSHIHTHRHAHTHAQTHPQPCTHKKTTSSATANSILFFSTQYYASLQSCWEVCCCYLPPTATPTMPWKLTKKYRKERLVAAVLATLESFFSNDLRVSIAWRHSDASNVPIQDLNNHSRTPLRQGGWRPSKLFLL